MIVRPLLIGLLLFAVQPAIGQELPLAKHLLQGDEKVVPDSLAPSPVAEMPQPNVVDGATDSSATDYVPPDAGAPGSLREDGSMLEDRSGRRNRSAVRLGIGIPLGLFTGVWISF